MAEAETAPGRIDTDRLVLVPLRVDHAHEMAEVLADPALYAFFAGAPPTAEIMRTRYAHLVAGSPDPAVSWCNWVVHLREAGCLTGFAQAIVTRSDQGSTAVVSLVTGRPWQGRGIGGEAAGGMLGWLRGQGVDSVVADIHPDNRASAGAAARSGFTRTGEVHGDKLRWRLRLSGSRS
ncbi:GNAT family N-acetyltransferase [Streptomyces sp. NPDC048171]|uniref:GNAT family N-acetyltransferase n=1 Tax=Streptomyces sp. NPDC048171 TaxID=3365504 RepID=UPI00371A5A44